MNAFKCLRVASRLETTSYSLLRPPIVRSATPHRFPQPQQRCLSILNPRRPVLPRTSSPALLIAPGAPPSRHPTSSTFSETLDLVGKISSHPSVGSTQIRCGPRDTYNPSHIVRKRRHGFLSRIKTRKGRKLIMKRLKKGRFNISH